MAAFCAPAWDPANKWFRLPKALGLIEFSTRLSQHLDNLVENAIRPLAIGRKNYMFCGNHDAAENAAIMYSLLGSCKACDVNPREWLIDVLSRIPEYNNDYSMDLAERLPHRWKASEKL